MNRALTLRLGGTALTLAILASVLSLGALSTPAAHAGPIVYPDARIVDHHDDYHGTEVADPYRWLEDPDDPESRAWIEAENEITYAWLADIPQRGPLQERLTELWNYERYTAPTVREGRYFFRHNDGLQNHAVLYVQDSLEGERRVLLDPNTLSQDGTVALSSTSVSEDGRYLAYSVSEGGSDWRTWRVRDVESGLDLDDVLEWSKFSGASWSKDSAGFFYSRYDEPADGEELEQANYNQKLYYHRVGTSQHDDVLVYERPDHPKWGIRGSVSDDGEYLILYVWQGSSSENRVYYKSLADPNAEVVELLDEADAHYTFVGNDGPLFYFKTDLDAPKGRLVAIDTNDPTSWHTLIPESDDKLNGVALLGDDFYVEYLHDAQDRIRQFDLKGAPRGEVVLPGIGSVSGFSGKRSDAEIFYSFSTFTAPSSIHRFEVATGSNELYRAPELDFDSSRYETKQVFFESKDGTKVPMFLVHKKGLVLDGTNPTYLYGYGGFNISMTPRFSTSRLVWLEMGGVYAQACLRGGGEYGEEWHKAGSLLEKQNTFDDFIAAGEYLIEEGYTSTPRLAIAGGSNGGLLVGACMTQRPDLFGACLPAVGVMDMLRFHKWTIGWAWVGDYGSSEDPEQFRALRAFSPYHNIEDGVSYPATFITTADHDDRVVPAHSFKFAARLQAAQGGDAPVLIRIQTRAGHGAGKPTSMRIQEEADRWAFLVRVMGLDGGSGI